MSNLTVQKSLEHLEVNLKNLKSARDQVVSVSDHTEQLTESVTKLISNIEILQKEYGNTKNKFLDSRKDLHDSLSKNIVDFNKVFEKRTKVFLTKSDELYDKHKVSVDSTVSILGNFQSNIKELEDKIKSLYFENKMEFVKAELVKLRQVIDSSENTQMNLINNIDKNQRKDLKQSTGAIIKEINEIDQEISTKNQNLINLIDSNHKLEKSTQKKNLQTIRDEFVQVKKDIATIKSIMMIIILFVVVALLIIAL
jgi:hypothetical protein